AERIDRPLVILLMGNQGADAEDRMIDVLGELVAHCSANVVIALANMTVGSGEALEVRNSLNVPDDDAGAHAGYPFSITTKDFASVLRCWPQLWEVQVRRAVILPTGPAISGAPFQTARFPAPRLLLRPRSRRASRRGSDADSTPQISARVFVRMVRFGG